MNQKEAIELALEMHAECEKRDAKGGRVCYISRMEITGCCGIQRDYALYALGKAK